jgi:hypothetical protein
MVLSHGLNRSRLLDAASGRRRDGRNEKRRQCSIGGMKRLLALVAGGLGLKALLKRTRVARRGHGSTPADELRAKLAAAKEQEEPQATPTVDERRADVHTRAREALDDLRQ